MTLTNKNGISSVVILFFTFIVLSGALISEFFQAPVISSKELSKLQILFSNKDLDSVKKIELKSSLGEFNLEDQEHGWVLTKPRKINANLKTVSLILNALKDIKIKKIYPKDSINLANFSLDNPIFSLSISNGDQFNKKIAFGLINPIDSSTYLTIDDENAIYHVNVLKTSLERIEMTNLIDSRIFNTSAKEITALKIYSQTSNSPTLQFKRVKDNWIHRNKKLNEQRVEKFLTNLTNMKSHTILDERTEKLQKRIDNYMKRSLFRLVITNSSGKEIEYKASYVLSSLPDITIEKRQLFILQASNREHPFLVHKDNIKLFYKKNSSFKPIPFKKLIY